MAGYNGEMRLRNAIEGITVRVVSAAQAATILDPLRYIPWLQRVTLVIEEDVAARIVIEEDTEDLLDVVFSLSNNDIWTCVAEPAEHDADWTLAFAEMVSGARG